MDRDDRGDSGGRRRRPSGSGPPGKNGASGAKAHGSGGISRRRDERDGDRRESRGQTGRSRDGVRSNDQGKRSRDEMGSGSRSRSEDDRRGSRDGRRRDGEGGRSRDGERGRRRDGEGGRSRDGERGRRRDGEQRSRGSNERRERDSGGRVPPRDDLPEPEEVLDWRVVREVEATGGAKTDATLEHLVAAALFYDDEDYEAAAREAESAKRLTPRASYIREILGIARYAAGDWARAMSELRTYDRLSGQRGHYPMVADCLRALGRPEKAMELLDEMRSDDDPEPLRIEAELVRAGVLQDEGKTREAIGALRIVLSEPTNVDVHHLRLWYMLADLFAEAGRPNEARTLFGRVAEHDPEFLDAAERAV